MERLASALAPDTLRARAALGDLHERFRRRHARDGAASAALWYLTQCPGLLRYRMSTGPARMSGIATDVGVSIRSLLRRPSLLLSTVLTLAPALAAAGVGLTLVWTVLLRPLPHPAAERLAVVEHSWGGFGSTGISTSLYEFYREHARSLDALGLVSWESVNMTAAGGEPRRIDAVRLTASSLDLLGARPALGRLLTPDQDRSGALRTVLLTHELWSETFGADPSVVGRSIRVDGVDRAVVGVLAPGLEFPGGEPLLVLPTEMESAGGSLIDIRWWYALARLAPGATPAGAERELGTLLRRAVVEAPDGNTTVATLEANGIAPLVTDLFAWQTRNARDFVILLAGAVLLLLALATAAAANLFLGRGEARAEELRIRRVLGASGGRVFAHLTSDALVLCLLSGGLAAAGAWAAVRALHDSSALALPRIDLVWLPVLAAGVALALAALLVPLFALIPLGHARLSGRSYVSPRVTPWTGLRRALLGVQVAASTVLLAAGFSLASSAGALADTPLGFRAEGVLTFQLALAEAAYPEEAGVRAFHRSVLERLEAVPGVVSAGHADGLPVPDQPWGGAMLQVEGHHDAGDVLPTHVWAHVSAGFLETLGVELLAGRMLEPREVREPAGSVVVNEAFARYYWSDARAAVGRRLRRWGTGPWLEVVGVVGNTADHGRGTEPEPLVYAPRYGSAWAVRGSTYALRTTVPPTQLVAAVRDVVAATDPTVPVFDVSTLSDRVARATARERLALGGVALSAGASVLVVVASLAGLLFLSVLQRRREIGVRKAMGATDARLRWLLLRGTLAPALAGLVVGAAVVAAGAQVPASLLHGGVDGAGSLPPTMVLVAVLVLVSGVWATGRVVRIQPAEALQPE